MLQFLVDFDSEFCRTPDGISHTPKPDFFWGRRDYKLMLERTLYASRQIELVAFVPVEQIQRGGGSLHESLLVSAQ
jgi:hypothetical protein